MDSGSNVDDNDDSEKSYQKKESNKNTGNEVNSNKIKIDSSKITSSSSSRDQQQQSQRSSLSCIFERQESTSNSSKKNNSNLLPPSSSSKKITAGINHHLLIPSLALNGNNNNNTMEDIDEATETIHVANDRTPNDSPSKQNLLEKQTVNNLSPRFQQLSPFEMEEGDGEEDHKEDDRSDTDGDNNNHSNNNNNNNNNNQRRNNNNNDGGNPIESMSLRQRIQDMLSSPRLTARGGNTAAGTSGTNTGYERVNNNTNPTTPTDNNNSNNSNSSSSAMRMPASILNMITSSKKTRSKAAPSYPSTAPTTNTTYHRENSATAGAGTNNITSPRTGAGGISDKLQGILPTLPDFGYQETIKSFTAESRFISWTREDLILLLIHHNIHIRKEEEIEKSDLIEYCDNYFIRKKLPNKRGPYTKRDWRRLNSAVLVLQNYWILYKIKKNKTLTKQELDMINDVQLLDDIEYDFSQEIFDLNDESLLLTSRSRQNSIQYSHNNNNNNNMPDIDLSELENGLTNMNTQANSQSTSTTTTTTAGGGTLSRPVSVALPKARGGKKGTEKDKKRELASKLVNLLDTPWTPPDWVSARRSMDFMQPRKGGKGGTPFETLHTTTGRHCFSGGIGEQCDLFAEGRVSEFSIYGPGVTNYFKFIKWLLWIMCVVSLITLPMVVINVTGGQSPGAQGLTDLAATTVGNLQAVMSANATATEEPVIYLPLCDPDVWGETTCGLNRYRLGMLYMTIDIIMTSIVLLGFLWLHYFEGHEESTLNKNTCYTSMFTIAVKNIPPDCTEDLIKSHFELALKRNFMIHCVDFAYDNEQEINDCKKRGDLIKSKNNLVNLHRYQCTKLRQDSKKSYDGIEFEIHKLREQFYAECKRIDKEMKEYDSVLTKIQRKWDVPKIAYLTFNECVGANLAYEMFRPSFVDIFFRNKNHYLDGYKLRVEPAPEPSTIIWENLNTPESEKLGRRVLSTSIASLLIVVSFILAFSARIIQYKYSTTNETSSVNSGICPTDFYTWTQTEQEVYVTDNPDTLSCYCDQYSLVSQENNDYCKDLARKQVSSQVLIYFASAIVLFINSLIEYVMEYCAKFEKHLSEDTKELSLFNRLFFLKYMNSSLVFLISSNASALSTSAVRLQTDFDVTWYQSLGVVLILVQIGDVFVAHFYCLFMYYIYHAKINHAKKDETAALTQSDLNKLHVGPSIQISTRYATLMSTFFLCMTFNTGIPILNSISAVSFLLFYFMEKFFFINLYKAPHRFGSKIGKTATMLVPVAIIIHLAMAIWVLSNSQIFSTSYGSTTVSNAVGSTTSSLPLSAAIQEKIRYSQTYPLFIFFILMIIGMVFYIFADTIQMQYIALMKWIKGRQFDVDRRNKIAKKLGLGALVNGGFKRAVERNLVKDIASYSILKNPKYKEKFAISWNFAMTHRRVSEVRLSMTRPSPAVTGTSSGSGSGSNKGNNYNNNSISNNGSSSARSVGGSRAITASNSTTTNEDNDVKKSRAKSVRLLTNFDSENNNNNTAADSTSSRAINSLNAANRNSLNENNNSSNIDSSSRDAPSIDLLDISFDISLDNDNDDPIYAETLRRTHLTQSRETDHERDVRLSIHSQHSASQHSASHKTGNGNGSKGGSKNASRRSSWNSLYHSRDSNSPDRNNATSTPVVAIPVISAVAGNGRDYTPPVGSTEFANQYYSDGGSFNSNNHYNVNPVAVSAANMSGRNGRTSTSSSNNGGGTITDGTLNSSNYSVGFGVRPNHASSVQSIQSVSAEEQRQINAAIAASKKDMKKRPSFTEVVFNDPQFHPTEDPIVLPGGSNRNTAAASAALHSNDYNSNNNNDAIDNYYSQQQFQQQRQQQMGISPPRRRQSAFATTTAGSNNNNANAININDMNNRISELNQNMTMTSSMDVVDAIHKRSGNSKNNSKNNTPTASPHRRQSGNVRFNDVEMPATRSTNSSPTTSALRRYSTTN